MTDREKVDVLEHRHVLLVSWLTRQKMQNLSLANKELPHVFSFAMSNPGDFEAACEAVHSENLHYQGLANTYDLILDAIDAGTISLETNLEKKFNPSNEYSI